MRIPSEIEALIRDTGADMGKATESMLRTLYLCAASLLVLKGEASPSEAALVDRKTAALALQISIATLDRIAAEPGAPVHYVGNRRRFNVPEMRAWLEARGKQPTKASSGDGAIDVSSIAARAGLRVAGGSR